ncbi:MAG: hypothetical protein K9N06_02515 [Candidatus Cloacimonetes bacterium]|nr:hypothetical protein [Candidatus Cloacimonadota bacterium]
MKVFYIRIFILILASLLASGCLSYEFKQYTFKVNDDGSGSGSIKFINLASQDEDSLDVSLADFDKLINDYLQGTSFEEGNPSFKVNNKELYEEDGVLCGIVEFTFDDYFEAGFYTDLNYFNDSVTDSVLIYYDGEFDEIVWESNGDDLSEILDMPVISWALDTKFFYIKTQSIQDDTNSHELLDIYNIWQQSQE